MKMTVIGINALMILKMVFKLWQSKDTSFISTLFFFFQPMCFLYFFDSFLPTLLKQVLQMWLINEVMAIL